MNSSEEGEIPNEVFLEFNVFSRPHSFPCKRDVGFLCPFEALFFRLERSCKQDFNYKPTYQEGMVFI